MHHITRVDRNTPHKHLWQVTVRRWNRVYTRSFSDRRHSGREQALAAAQGYRDSILAQQTPMPRRTRCAVLKRNNRSGVAGVTRILLSDPRDKQAPRSACWVARWPGDGKTIRQRSFSVSKHGEWGAFLKAVEARQHGLATMDDEPPASRNDQAPELMHPAITEHCTDASYLRMSAHECVRPALPPPVLPR